MVCHSPLILELGNIPHWVVSHPWNNKIRKNTHAEVLKDRTLKIRRSAFILADIIWTRHNDTIELKFIVHQHATQYINLVHMTWTFWYKACQSLWLDYFYDNALSGSCYIFNFLIKSNAVTVCFPFGKHFIFHHTKCPAVYVIPLPWWLCENQQLKIELEGKTAIPTQIVPLVHMWHYVSESFMSQCAMKICKSSNTD